MKNRKTVRPLHNLLICTPCGFSYNLYPLQQRGMLFMAYCLCTFPLMKYIKSHKAANACT